MRQKNFFSLYSVIAAMFAFLFSGNVLAHENADILGLNPGYLNSATVEQNDDGSWTIVTTGSDPYVATSGLSRDLTEAETSLTFEYQASADCPLEFFFSTKVGNSYATGYSYNLGNAPKTSEWKRVTIDITKARQEWGWGLAGHTLRVDAGVAEGMTFQIRDLHACTDAPMDPMEGYTIQDGAIQINSQEDFDKWIAGFSKFLTKAQIPYTNVCLNTDVAITSTTGSVIPQFNAVLDGKGHKLTIDMSYTLASGESVEVGHAPISLLYGTVKNLVVDGTISGNSKYLASVAKDCHNGAVIENVVSYVNIVSEISGDGTHGGINGRNEGSTTFRNVMFAGTISGSATTSCGGITGWCNAKSSYEGVLMIAAITVDPASCNTITRNQGNAIIKNVYALAPGVTETPAGVVLVTPEQLASGEVCFGLNGDQRTIGWYQTLGEDEVPTLDSTHGQVYSDGEYNCDGTLISETATYSNEGTVNIPDHEWNEFGTCDNCGQGKPGFIEQNADGYFLVNTPEQLVYMSNYATNNPTAKILITQDLDMAEVTDQYRPIRGAYAGIFDGGGHTISNLIINNVPNETTGEGATTVNDQALIGLAGGCTVKNLTLDATCSITGGGYSAGFVGETTGSVTITMENLFMHGNVRAEGPNGAGIYGCNMSSTATIVMKNCGVTGNIVGNNEAGALSGWFGGGKATVTNCWFTGTIEGCDNSNQQTFCRPASDVTLTNCWTYQGSQSGVNNLSTEDAAKNGELTWKLNGSKFTGITWYQNLDEEDVCPSLDPTRGIVYQTTDGYATVIESDAESFGKFMKGLQDVGLAYIESEDAQNYANVNLLAEYVELVNAYSATTDMGTITEAYNAERAKYNEVTASVTAYKNYEATVNDILNTLETRDDFSGDDRDFLEGIYLGENAAPGEYEAAPNGTYEYIMETRTLTTKEVNAETEYVKELLRIAVANGYTPGTEITNMLVNANFAEGFTGWKGTVFTGHGASPTEGSTMHAAEIWSANNHDMYQEIVAAKSGIYELQIRGGYRAYNNAMSGQLSPYIYMNGNANYLQSVLDGAIPADEAVDGVNCNLTGGVNDLPILNEEGDTIAWAMHGVISLNKAFEAGRHDNRLVLLAQEGDTIRLGVKHTYFNGMKDGAVQNDWVGIGDIHLTYHGEMEDSEEAIDRALESMLARANSLQGIQFASDDTYTNYPNYSKTIQDRLAAAIEKGNGAADVATKYEVIEELSAVFKEAIESKMAYKHYFAEVEKVVDYAYLAYEMDEVKYKELAAAAAAIQEEGFIAYENGSLSTEEANECAIAKTVPVYPTIDENGTYHVANTAQMAYVTNIIKNENNAINVALDGDVYFNTSMMMTDFYGDLDGQDHTITVNIERTADNAAIFENIRGSEIKNLIVRGSIVTPNKYAAAIAAHAHDACKIYRVQSWVDIQGNIVGDGTHAGIVAVNESGNLDLSYSMFAGTMSGTAANNGGLVGWGTATVDAKNCLIIANITTSPESSNIIARNSVTAKDCYFLTPYGGTPAGAYQITEDQLANGYVTYMLNSGKTRKDVVWRQNLDGSDIVPTLDPTHKIVYMTADSTFSNEMQNEIEKYEGTESDPYIINTPQDMALLRRFMLPGRVNYVKLGADIDMAEITSWTPLNMDGDKADGRNYQNIIDFDGQGHVISNFSCTDPNTSYNSFFGILNGNVRNVGFKNAVVASEKTGTGILGGYIGHNDFQNADATKAVSKIENVWVSGQLTGSKDYIGGFFGTVAGPTVVKNCYSNIEIISDAPYVGGIAGRVRDQFHVDQAYAAGSITTTSEENVVGGIIGGAQQAVTEPGYYNNIVVWNNQDQNFGPTVEAKEVTYPVADLLDVVFNADGTATDISPAQQEIEVVGEPKVAYSEKFGQNVFFSESDGTTPVSYLKIDYSENQELKDALTDGYTIETTIAIHNTALTGTVKPFCATETGGFGFEILSSGQMKHINHTDIDGTKAYRYANTSVYAKMDTYYHMVGVYNKANRKVFCYINGVNAAEGAAEGVLHFPDNATHQWIGIGADAGVQSGANFEIINARIYNEPISADMAKALYWKQNGRDFYTGDKVSNISFYDGSNFAALQQVVVDWGKPWQCDMAEGSYPTFDGTLADGIQGVESNAVKGKIFNINGIQVEKTTKGIYIIDGKKIMVK